MRAKRKKENIFDVDNIDLTHLTERRKIELKEILDEFKPIWDGHIGEMNIT